MIHCARGDAGWLWAIGRPPEGEKRPLWLRARRLSSFAGRLRGLLGTDEGADPVIIERCRSIHTWGMRYAIDVAFVSPAGRVTLAKRAVPPQSGASSREAAYAIERPSSSGRWLEEGDEVRLERIR